MNILYIHGFGSCFNQNSEKVRALSEIGEVFGIEIDYTKLFTDIEVAIIGLIIKKDIDLIVGTSMGGFCASVTGTKTGVPFVAINPVLEPVKTLSKYIGDGIDFSGNTYKLERKTLSSYPSFSLNGCGLILLDRGDELIDSNQTAKILDQYYKIRIFDHGHHRFAHIQESLDDIRIFNITSLVYGFGAENDL